MGTDSIDGGQVGINLTANGGTSPRDPFENGGNNHVHDKNGGNNHDKRGQKRFGLRGDEVQVEEWSFEQKLPKAFLSFRTGSADQIRQHLTLAVLADLDKDRAEFTALSREALFSCGAPVLSALKRFPTEDEYVAGESCPKSCLHLGRASHAHARRGIGAQVEWIQSWFQRSKKHFNLVQLTAMQFRRLYALFVAMLFTIRFNLLFVAPVVLLIVFWAPFCRDAFAAEVGRDTIIFGSDHRYGEFCKEIVGLKGVVPTLMVSMLPSFLAVQYLNQALNR